MFKIERPMGGKMKKGNSTKAGLTMHMQTERTEEGEQKKRKE
jgi:hypothetical protein